MSARSAERKQIRIFEVSTPSADFSSYSASPRAARREKQVSSMSLRAARSFFLLFISVPAHSANKKTTTCLLYPHAQREFVLISYRSLCTAEKNLFHRFFPNIFLNNLE